jgi:hypothetical protein
MTPETLNWSKTPTGTMVLSNDLSNSARMTMRSLVSVSPARRFRWRPHHLAKASRSSVSFCCTPSSASIVALIWARSFSRAPKLK